MSYDSNLLKQVAQDFSQKRKNREALIESRKAELYEKIPELINIDMSLSKLSFSAFLRVADGLDPNTAADEILKAGKKLSTERKKLLKEHGYTPDYLEPPYDCDKCKDEGFLDNGYCTCFEQALISYAFSESNLASLAKNSFSDFSLDLYDTEPDAQLKVSPRENMTRILRVCKKFVEDFDSQQKGLLFYGAPGLGKTMLSSCIASELLSRGYSVIYQSAGTIFSTLDALRFNKGVDEAQRYAASRMLTVDLLILDDLGTEFLTDFSVSELFRILNTRQLTGKKTIISTNLSIANMRSMYSERILSRIFGGFELLPFFGGDIRLTKQIKN